MFIRAMALQIAVIIILVRVLMMVTVIPIAFGAALMTVQMRIMGVWTEVHGNPIIMINVVRILSDVLVLYSKYCFSFLYFGTKYIFFRL